jgi:uncharacterized protein
VEQNSIWIIGALALAVGGLIGYLLGRSGSDAGQRQILSKQLDDTQAELATYKQDVTEHFEKTAELVNQLTNTYKDVHQHLASGAQSLCEGDTASLALKEDVQAKLSTTPDAEAPIPVVTDVVPNDEAEKVPEPPRDYAAKSSNEKGMLSEAYGLDSKADESDDEPLTSPAELAALKEREKAKEKEKVKEKQPAKPASSDA